MQQLSINQGYEAIRTITHLRNPALQPPAFQELVPRLPRTLWPHALRIAGILLDQAGTVAVAQTITTCATPRPGRAVALDLVLQAVLLDDPEKRAALLEILSGTVPDDLIAAGREWATVVSRPATPATA